MREQQPQPFAKRVADAMWSVAPLVIALIAYIMGYVAGMEVGRDTMASELMPIIREHSAP
jgi:hypothetical protein